MTCTDFERIADHLLARPVVGIRARLVAELIRVHKLGTVEGRKDGVRIANKAALERELREAIRGGRK